MDLQQWQGLQKQNPYYGFHNSRAICEASTASKPMLGIVGHHNSAPTKIKSFPNETINNPTPCNAILPYEAQETTCMLQASKQLSLLHHHHHPHHHNPRHHPAAPLPNLAPSQTLPSSPPPNHHQHRLHPRHSVVGRRHPAPPRQ